MAASTTGSQIPSANTQSDSEMTVLPRFLRLPRELRDKIYCFVLVDQETLIRLRTQSFKEFCDRRAKPEQRALEHPNLKYFKIRAPYDRIIDTAIFCINKQIHSESRQIFTQENAFVLPPYTSPEDEIDFPVFLEMPQIRLDNGVLEFGWGMEFICNFLESHSNLRVLTITCIARLLDRKTGEADYILREGEIEALDILWKVKVKDSVSILVDYNQFSILTEKEM
jgi:hypothetical protein